VSESLALNEYIRAASAHCSWAAGFNLEPVKLVLAIAGLTPGRIGY